MSDYVANVDAVSLRAVVRAEIEDIDGKKGFWYDGHRFRLLNRYQNLYATADAMATIDETLDHLIENYGVEVPLADFIVHDPFESPSQFLDSATYVGIHEVEGRSCHHLACARFTIDW